MASLNTSHHADGGVLLYSGELVLLYSDSVNLEVDRVGNSNGRLFLTTHRIVFTSQPINKNPRLMSLAAPFYAMFDLGLEQPVFGANYIRGKVRTNSSQNTSPLNQNEFTFKMKFNKGGACEFGRALCSAAKQASSIAQQSGWSSSQSFTNTPAGQYYAAPSTTYQPDYPIGFVLPNQIFNQAPQNGTIYYQTSPPPYPGLIPAHQMQQQSAYDQMYPVVNLSNTAPVYETGDRNIYPTQMPPMPGFASPSNVPPPPYQQMPAPNYGANFNTTYPNQQSAAGYVPTTNSQNTYPQQYPTPPSINNGPQTNNTYPNLPTNNNGDWSKKNH